jgi:hypothetical protein
MFVFFSFYILAKLIAHGKSRAKVCRMLQKSACTKFARKDGQNPENQLRMVHFRGSKYREIRVLRSIEKI